MIGHEEKVSSGTRRGLDQNQEKILHGEGSQVLEGAARGGGGHSIPGGVWKCVDVAPRDSLVMRPKDLEGLFRLR